MSKLNNQIVYTALTRMTADRAVIKEAFLHWQNHLGDIPLDVFEVVEHIESFLGLTTAEKKVLMVSMHSASAKSETDLANVPPFIINVGGDISEEQNETEFQVVDNKPPHVILSEGYFNGMLSGLQRTSGKFFQELKEILLEEGLPEGPKTVEASLKRINESNIDLPSDMNETDCQSFCHEVYMLVCDVIGPVKSDDLSYKAIAQLLETNEASRYDPKKLI